MLLPAFQVIQEIDDMMQDTPSSEGDLIEYNEALEKGKEVLSSPLYEDSECPYLNAQSNILLGKIVYCTVRGALKMYRSGILKKK